MFDILTGIFNRVRLQTNIRKTVRVVCRPIWASRAWAYKAYTRNMTGKGWIFK